jgi:hypothetical protein
MRVTGRVWRILRPCFVRWNCRALGTCRLWVTCRRGSGHDDCYDRKSSNICMPDCSNCLELVVDRCTTKHEAPPQEEIAVEAK